MTFKDVVLSMWQYWAMGGAMLAATAYAGYSEFIRVEKKAVVKFAMFMALVTLWRLISMTFLLKIPAMRHAAENVTIIPIPATLTVFWEDACHGLPLLLVQTALGMDKLYKKIINYVILAVVMFSFGSGHLYQGTAASLMLMLYIPYSIRFGKKYGFGTVMICHTLYDLLTIVTIKYSLGSLF